MKEIESLFKHQKSFYHNNHTRHVAYRKSLLRQFREVLRRHENDMFEAINKDFGKSAYETYETEISLLYHEIKLTLKNLKHWAKAELVPTNLPNLPGKSYIVTEPYGNALVIGAWNYPFLLSLHPAVSALAAGNTVVVKPSELAPATSALMHEMINNNFDEEVFHCVEGGVEETTELLNQPFDKIFFTGSPRVGKIVMRAAAEHLSSVTLELGGKSPAIVFPDANLKMAAKRIAWGKFLNAGQTCIAPDYLMIHESVKEAFLLMLRKETENNLGEEPASSEAYTKIINDSHFDRLNNLIDREKVLFGGDTNPDNRYIEPTVLENVSFEDAVMQEEIFGPILPVITFSNTEQMIAEVKKLAKPLALYVFTKSKKAREKVLLEVPFGGGAVNDTIMHLSNPNLPFGGVNNSGLGSYHGKAGFDTFSHKKSILQKSTLFEPPVKFPPYKPWKWKVLRWLME